MAGCQCRPETAFCSCSWAWASSISTIPGHRSRMWRGCLPKRPMSFRGSQAKRRPASSASWWRQKCAKRPHNCASRRDRPPFTGGPGCWPLHASAPLRCRAWSCPWRRPMNATARSRPFGGGATIRRGPVTGVPPGLRAAARQDSLQRQRWMGMLAIAAQRAFAHSLLELPPASVDASSSTKPPLGELLADARGIRIVPSRLPAVMGPRG